MTVHSEHKLSQIGAALHSSSAFSGLLYGRQKKADKYANDRNNNK
jgi:hypothetical protein